MPLVFARASVARAAEDVGFGLATIVARWCISLASILDSTLSMPGQLMVWRPLRARDRLDDFAHRGFSRRVVMQTRVFPDDLVLPVLIHMATEHRSGS